MHPTGENSDVKPVPEKPRNTDPTLLSHIPPDSILSIAFTCFHKWFSDLVDIGKGLGKWASSPSSGQCYM